MRRGRARDGAVVTRRHAGWAAVARRATPLLVTAAAVMARPARADPPPVALRPAIAALRWTRLAGAEACVGEADLVRLVELRLGRPAFAPDAAGALTINARIAAAPRARGWVATIELSDERGAVVGNRSLRSSAASCREFDDTLALVIALMIDPDAVASAEPAPRVQPAPQPADAAPALRAQPQLPTRVPLRSPAARRGAAPSSPSPSPRGPVRPPWRWHPRASGVVAIGLLPGLAAGAAVALRIEPPWFIPVEISASALAGGRAAGPDADAGGEFAWVDGGLALCPARAFGPRVHLGLCAGARGGAVLYRAFGLVSAAGIAAAPTVVLAAQAHGVIAIAGPLEGYVALGALVPLTRQRFVYTDWQHLDASGNPREVEVFATPPVAGTLELGVALRFPP